MHPARPTAMALMALVFGVACGGTTPVTTGVTAEQLRTHPEAKLIYPHSHNAWHSETDEYDGGSFVPLRPAPAYAQIGLETADRVDLVIAWYDSWLRQHGWQDVVVQGDGSRSWTRGPHEDFFVDCSYQTSTGTHICSIAYTLRSARFKATVPAAPAFGDPVSLAAVQQRQVGLAATEDKARYVSGDAIPRDGTPEASAARLGWPTKFCCATPVIVLDTASAERPSPLRSAYHAVTIEAAEYDRPDVRGGSFGSIERNEAANLADSGFVLEKTGGATLRGQHANAYAYVRGDREVVLFAIAYGTIQDAASRFKFRVATLSIIYDVAPSSCPPSNADCFSALFGAKDTEWSAPAALA